MEVDKRKTTSKRESQKSLRILDDYIQKEDDEEEKIINIHHTATFD